MNTRLKRNRFSMLEIVLALVVIVVGIVGIMSLLPVGFNANQQAIAESNAADAAEQFLHFAAAEATADWSFLNAFPEEKPGFAGPPSDDPSGGNKTQNTSITGDPSDLELLWSNGTMLSDANVRIHFNAVNSDDGFSPNSHNTGMFRVKQMTDGLVEDFDGIMRVWQEVTRVDALGRVVTVTLKVEISYPGAVAYENREKDVFNTEIFRPELEEPPPEAAPTKCVSTTPMAPGESVEGVGTLFESLTVSTGKGNGVAYSEGSEPVMFFAPNDGSVVAQGCINAGYAFADSTADERARAHDFVFSFTNGVTVNAFSIRMVDYGDYNIAGATEHSVSLVAYNASGNELDRHTLHYTSTSDLLPRSGNGSPGDLYYTGDACSAGIGDPGNFTFWVKGAGISKTKLEFSHNGNQEYKVSDPGIAFTNICFPAFCPQVEGDISLNPNNHPESEFSLTKPDGSRIEISQLTSDVNLDEEGMYYDGPATSVRLAPKGNGSQTALTFNGVGYTIKNNHTYTITGDLIARIWNNRVVDKKGLGRWMVTFTPRCAAIDDLGDDPPPEEPPDEKPPTEDPDPPEPPEPPLRPQYIIISSATEGGTITPDGTTTVAAGGNQSYIIAPFTCEGDEPVDPPVTPPVDPPVPPVDPPLEPPTDDPEDKGLYGGHIDVDTDSSLGDDTDGHVHEYDDKYDTNVIDYFNIEDSKLQNIGDVITNSSQRFILVVGNGDLSPGGMLQINGSRVAVGTYDDIPTASLPVYSMGNVAGATRLSGLSFYFAPDTIDEGGVIPTNTGDVRGNEPGRRGEWRNGALTLQAIPVDADGNLAGPLDRSVTSGGVQGLASECSGMLFETTIFWHWDGDSYHDSGWDFTGPAASAAGPTTTTPPTCDDLTPPSACGNAIGDGDLNINPAESAGNMFSFTNAAGTTDMDDMKDYFHDNGNTNMSYSGAASEVKIKVKAQGRTISINGVPVELLTNIRYTFSGDMTIDLRNTKKKPKSWGAAHGHWWLDISGASVCLDPVPGGGAAAASAASRKAASISASSASTSSDFRVQGGDIVLSNPQSATVSILGVSASIDLPITTSLSINGDKVEPWGAYTSATGGNVDGETGAHATGPLPVGATISAKARSWTKRKADYSGNADEHWQSFISADSTTAGARVLRNGYIAPAESVALLGDIVSNGRVTLPGNDAIILFELTSNDTADFADLALLVSFDAAASVVAPAASSASEAGPVTDCVSYRIADVVVDGLSVGPVKTYTFSNVRADHTINAIFVPINAEDPPPPVAPATYTITATAGDGGSIAPPGVTVVNAGGSQAYGIGPADGYRILQVRVDGVSMGALASYTFDNVQANHTIHATFELIPPNSYTITATNTAGGTLTPTGVTTVTEGGSQAYGARASAGYSLGDVQVDGTSIGANANYSFTDVNANHAIHAVFTLNTYTVTATAGEGGSISDPGVTTVNYGDGKGYTFTAADGYEVEDVKVDGVSLGARGSFNFYNISKDRTIHVTFVEKTYSIVASATAGGSIAPEGTSTVSHGANKSYAITANTGYEIQDVEVDGASIGATGDHDFTNVQADHTIHAIFRVKVYSITSTTTVGGTIDPLGVIAVNHGGDQAYAMAADECNNNPPAFRIEGGAIINEEALDADVQILGAAISASGEYDMPVTVRINAGGTHEPFGGFYLPVTGNVNDGANPRTWTAPTTLPADTRITVSGQSWIKKRSSYSGASNSHWKTYINKDSNSNSPSIMTLRDGDTAPAIEPFLNQAEIVDFLGDIVQGGVVHLAENQAIFLFEIGTTNMASSAADFQDLVVLISYRKPAATPTECYTLQDVLVDGVSVGAVADYEFSNVTADHTIHSVYSTGTTEPTSYTITATATAGGSISPAGATTVEEGEAQGYAAAATAGHVLVDVLVDGASIGVPTSYNFTNVVADHSIHAVFEAADPEDDGLLNGHIDVDTDSERGNDTDGHVHEYDDKYDTNVVDYFNIEDSKLQNIGEVITDSSQRFILVVGNADLSPGALLDINGSRTAVATYDNTPVTGLTVYSMGNVSGATRLNSLSFYFDRDAIDKGKVIPTNTGDVRGNEPGRKGEWRNGALTLQAIPVNADGSLAGPLDLSVTSGGVQGLASECSGMLFETTIFWHWDGDSYHEGGWDFTGPAASAAGPTTNQPPNCNPEPPAGDSVAGSVNLNYSTKTDKIFKMTTPAGEVDMKDLKNTGGTYYTGPATSVTFRPRSADRSLDINGTSVNLATNTTYTITGALTVGVSNSNSSNSWKKNKKDWNLSISGSGVSITPAP